MLVTLLGTVLISGALQVKPHDADVSLSHQQECVGSGSILTEHSASPQTTDQESCGDPCHSGHAHFGHCLFTSAPVADSNLMVHFAKSNRFAERHLLAAPDLEARRRPPRLA